MHSKKQRRVPVPIGWKEVIDLPEWGIRNLVAKSDTGAQSSAIDVRDIEPLPGGRVRFTVAAHREDRDLRQTIEADVVKETQVRSSNGIAQRRLKVRTTLKVGTVRKKVEFSLVDRHHMICRAILGREALAGHFVVDPENKYLHGPKKKAVVHD